MPAHHLQYRGYKVKIMRSETGWHIEAVPRTPREPYLQLFSFSVDVVSEEDAISLIQKEIDGGLDT
jgi:hypothetical protein